MKLIGYSTKRDENCIRTPGEPLSRKWSRAGVGNIDIGCKKDMSNGPPIGSYIHSEYESPAIVFNFHSLMVPPSARATELAARIRIGLRCD